ncbi:Calcium-dependent protein kinase 8 [Platanthera zijinensis]|uniref:Calcium-dependent protein kinase 8 n=1 Tax=Platanthera zijinensis TaxID=2320716 RepID=A0AAP0FT96_9ASPA
MVPGLLRCAAPRTSPLSSKTPTGKLRPGGDRIPEEPQPKHLLPRVVAEHLSVEEVADIKQMFEKMDKNKNGRISLEGLEFRLHKLGNQLPNADVQILMEPNKKGGKKNSPSTVPPSGQESRCPLQDEGTAALCSLSLPDSLPPLDRQSRRMKKNRTRRCRGSPLSYTGDGADAAAVH